MTTISHQCPNCQSPLSPPIDKCPYCQTELTFDENTEGFKVINSSDFSDTDLWKADFGFRNANIITFAMIVAALIYAYGWKLEDQLYWLAAEAVIVWAGILPLWLAVVAFSWKALWGQWLPGFAVGTAIFLTHMLRMFLIRGSFINDNGVGISAIFGGAALGGWIIGRVIHLYIRNTRAKSLKIGN